MLKIMLPLMLALCVGNANANSIDTKHSNHDSAIKELRKEVRALKKDIKRLEVLVLKLSMTGSIGHSENDNIWGCYLNDHVAGGVYGTGRTETEAKGKALEKCARKEGMCFDSQVKCSVDSSY